MTNSMQSFVHRPLYNISNIYMFTRFLNNTEAFASELFKKISYKDGFLCDISLSYK